MWSTPSLKIHAITPLRVTAAELAQGVKFNIDGEGFIENQDDEDPDFSIAPSFAFVPHGSTISEESFEHALKHTDAATFDTPTHVTFAVKHKVTGGNRAYDLVTLQPKAGFVVISIKPNALHIE